MTVVTSTNKRQRPSRLSRWWSAFLIIFDNKVATIGFCMVAFWFLVGILSFLWTPHPPNAPIFLANQPPSLVNWLGTDHLGRDILSRLMAGTQIVLLKTRLTSDYWVPGGVAIWGVLGVMFLGALFGLNAGYRGGWSDTGIMQLLDAFIAFPVIVLYLVIVSSFGRSDLVVIVAIVLTGTPGAARLVRGMTLDIKSRDYVQAAQTRGESSWWIMRREILPNASGPLVVDGMMRVGYAIFAIGTLGFLGIGLPPPEPDWGSMVNGARADIFSHQLPVLWPALAIASLVIGLNLLADGLREEMTRYRG